MDAALCATKDYVQSEDTSSGVFYIPTLVLRAGVDPPSTKLALQSRSSWQWSFIGCSCSECVVHREQKAYLIPNDPTENVYKDRSEYKE